MVSSLEESVVKIPRGKTIDELKFIYSPSKKQYFEYTPH